MTSDEEQKLYDQHLNLYGQFSYGCFFEVSVEQDGKIECAIYSNVAHDHPDPRLKGKSTTWEHWPRGIVQVKQYCQIVDSDHVKDFADALRWLSDHQCW